MRTLLLLFGLVAAASAVFLAGCGTSIGGPRFWWDDRNQVRLSEEYHLPDDPAAPADYGAEYASSASGEDLSEDNLRDYRANLDQEEEKRKSEASLLDF